MEASIAIKADDELKTTLEVGQLKADNNPWQVELFFKLLKQHLRIKAF